MSSLAPLAHAAAAPPFNTDFYVTIATVIPVLFLAIAVQGPVYQDLVQALRAIDIKHRSRLRRTAGGMTYALVWQFLYFILIAGFAGELFALIAIAVHKEASGEQAIMLVLTAILLAGVVIGPTLILTGRTLPKSPATQGGKPATAQNEPPHDESGETSQA